MTMIHDISKELAKDGLLAFGYYPQDMTYNTLTHEYTSAVQANTDLSIFIGTDIAPNLVENFFWNKLSYFNLQPASLTIVSTHDQGFVLTNIDFIIA
ncbi:hypothetical protein [Entomospira culicis]|uniref:Uncharacterized protein n=1 Tax=Entomospira culicis TaxID=2719989 RepID=A0A968GF12_9SPIO|nr:hypothetical protein [Entomospira culicis]NIZ19089.1 hypothetical protein [Entomospira culicis]NIZ69303.1 hypothetical protein [Entomospira culicis]WDI37889.1 hypothetical protein PVA46_03630 [Entomospira culicis]WDI39516.1 hypothetical protein PVA47_03630 [Entomospira culicis]